MSQTIWANAFLPTTPVGQKQYPLLEAEYALPNMREFAEQDEDLVVLPDPRSFRSMSRAAVLLSAACLESAEALKPFLQEDPFSVGIYCAVENGATDYKTAKEIPTGSPDTFAKDYKKLRNAKYYFKQLPNLAASQLGMFLGINGPLHIFHHSVRGSLQALAQAEFELQEGIVKAALVCSAFAFDDPLSSLRARRDAGADCVLSEGSAGLILVKGKSRSQFPATTFPKANESFWNFKSHYFSCKGAS